MSVYWLQTICCRSTSSTCRLITDSPIAALIALADKCPLSGAKRTRACALHMSAFDPKRTSVDFSPTRFHDRHRQEFRRATPQGSGVMDKTEKRGLSRRAFLETGAAAATFGVLGSSQAATAQPASAWNQGQLIHLIPTANHERFLIK